MHLAVYKSLWGFPVTDGDSLAAIATDYDGVEVDLPLGEGDRQIISEGCDHGDLSLITQFALVQRDPQLQLEEFRARLDEAANLGANTAVVLSGRDSWSATESIKFFEAAVEIEKSVGLPVAHETHRRHSLMAPWIASKVLNAVSDLRLCCDFSHWVVVCERLLDEDQDDLRLVAERALHIHARVGTEQAPQVRNPADRDVGNYLAAFEYWWELVWNAQESAGMAVSTVTPEYGPPPYQPVHGEAGELAGELAVICDWQAARIKEQFGERHG